MHIRVICNRKSVTYFSVERAACRDALGLASRQAVRTLVFRTYISHLRGRTLLTGLSLCVYTLLHFHSHFSKVRTLCARTNTARPTEVYTRIIREVGRTPNTKVKAVSPGPAKRHPLRDAPCATTPISACVPHTFMRRVLNLKHHVNPCAHDSIWTPPPLAKGGQ